MTSRSQFHPFTAAAILTLAACGGGGADTNSANIADNSVMENEAAAPANETAAPSQAAPATAGAVTADFMIGKWSATNEDCSEVLEFRKDGTVKTPIGDAKWTLAGDQLAGDQLAVDFGDGSTLQPSTIKSLGPDRIEISDASGKETQKRC